jgi:hypothetical protein
MPNAQYYKILILVRHEPIVCLERFVRSVTGFKMA